MRFTKLFYTFFGIGYIKIAPGTFASFFASALVYLLSLFFYQEVRIVLLILLLVFVAIFNLLRNKFFVLWGTKDPKCVVVDEVMGVLLYVLLLNNTKLKWLMIGFVVFRFFDVLKPFPLKHLQNINNVNSVILDDLGAAIYTCMVVFIAMKIIN